MAYCSEYGTWKVLEKSGPETAPKHSIEVGAVQLKELDSRSLRTAGARASISRSVMKPLVEAGVVPKSPSPPGRRALCKPELTTNNSERALPKSARANRRRVSIAVSQSVPTPPPTPAYQP